MDARLSSADDTLIVDKQERTDPALGKKCMNLCWVTGLSKDQVAFQNINGDFKDRNRCKNTRSGCFSITLYQNLANCKCIQRPWLLYSLFTGAVFCFTRQISAMLKVKRAL